MAALYGTLQGNRGVASRTGSKSSGMQAQVQTYKSAVRVELEADDRVLIKITHPKTGRAVLVWEGNAADALERGALE